MNFHISSVCNSDQNFNFTLKGATGRVKALTFPPFVRDNCTTCTSCRCILYACAIGVLALSEIQMGTYHMRTSCGCFTSTSCGCLTSTSQGCLLYACIEVILAQQVLKRDTYFTTVPQKSWPCMSFKDQHQRQRRSVNINAIKQH